MVIIKSIIDLKKVIRHTKNQGNTIGFVPTMGYLHEGYMSLIKASRKDNDFTVVSIFVNPTQFGVNEDFSKYPRDFERDCRMAESEGVDVVFAPTANETAVITWLNTDMSDSGRNKIMTSLFDGVEWSIPRNLLDIQDHYYNYQSLNIVNGFGKVLVDEHN